MDTILEALKKLLGELVYGLEFSELASGWVVAHKKERVVIFYIEDGNIVVMKARTSLGSGIRYLRDFEGEDSKSRFDILDPRAIIASVRAVCRRLGEDLPSVERVDEVIKLMVPRLEF